MQQNHNSKCIALHNYMIWNINYFKQQAEFYKNTDVGKRKRSVDTRIHVFVLASNILTTYLRCNFFEKCNCESELKVLQQQLQWKRFEELTVVFCLITGMRKSTGVHFESTRVNGRFQLLDYAHVDPVL